jgi:hypothetical protein
MEKEKLNEIKEEEIIKEIKEEDIKEYIDNPLFFIDETFKKFDDKNDINSFIKLIQNEFSNILIKNEDKVKKNHKIDTYSR